MLTETDFREFVNLFISNYNKHSYEYILSRMNNEVVFICPEVNALLVKTPRTIIHGKENIVAYWKNLKKVTRPEVSKIEFLDRDQLHKVRFHYAQINLIMDAHFQFEPNEKLSKIEFLIVS